MAGSTENATLVRTLLADLVDRGLDPEQTILFVIDGGHRRCGAPSTTSSASTRSSIAVRARRSATTAICRPSATATGCARMRAAWSLTDADLAERRVQVLVGEPDTTWPDAAASLRERIADTLTLMRLGITGQLAKTLCSTTPASR